METSKTAKEFILNLSLVIMVFLGVGAWTFIAFKLFGVYGSITVIATFFIGLYIGHDNDKKEKNKKVEIEG